MERSEIRGGRFAGPSLPDCASLHPGYERKIRKRNAGKRRVTTAAPCGAARALLERARLTAFHHGSHL